jgi:cytochrome P450
MSKTRLPPDDRPAVAPALAHAVAPALAAVAAPSVASAGLPASPPAALPAGLPSSPVAAPAIDWRPDDPATLADPYALFARMRDEDPCHWSPRLKSWVLTRYDDVKAVLLDGTLSSDRLRPFFAAMPAPERERIADIVRYLSLWMVFTDPPEHTRLRRLTGRVFHARRMQGMRPVVERIAERLLDDIEREVPPANPGTSSRALPARCPAW